MADLISRRAAIKKALDSINCFRWVDDSLKIVCGIIEHVPAAHPERKKGKWVLKPNIYGVAYCSECDYELYTNNTNYCPNCGAKMEAENESD